MAKIFIKFNRLKHRINIFYSLWWIMNHHMNGFDIFFSSFKIIQIVQFNWLIDWLIQVSILFFLFVCLNHLNLFVCLVYICVVEITTTTNTTTTTAKKSRVSWYLHILKKHVLSITHTDANINSCFSHYGIITNIYKKRVVLKGLFIHSLQRGKTVFFFIWRSIIERLYVDAFYAHPTLFFKCTVIYVHL